MNRNPTRIFFLALMVSAIFTTSLFSAEMIAIVTFKSGDVSLKRKDKESALTKGITLEKKDTIITRDGFADIQLGDNSIIRIGKNSNFSLAKIIEDDSKIQVELKLNKGSVLTKVVKKLSKNSDYKIITPSVVAGVRGTEFMVQEGEDTESTKVDEKIKGGVYVKEGSVVVNTDYSSKEIAVNAGEELVCSQKKLKAEVLEAFVSEKLRILETLTIMQELNKTNLNEQLEKNKEFLKK